MEDYLFSRFGISLGPGISIREAGDGRLLAYASSLDSFNAQGEETRGIVAVRKNGAMKPTSDFLQLFGWMCTRNAMFLGDRDAADFCSGKTVLASSPWCTRGYVAVSCRGVVLGCAFYDGEKIESLVPHHKRVMSVA
jgi:NOL1/NOP2/fmu family ribosome biogenesis protein